MNKDILNHWVIVSFAITVTFLSCKFDNKLDGEDYSKNLLALEDDEIKKTY